MNPGSPDQNVLAWALYRTAGDMNQRTSLVVHVVNHRLGLRERTEIVDVGVANASQFLHGDGTSHSALAMQQQDLVLVLVSWPPKPGH